jgi:hypothetical protein
MTTPTDQLEGFVADVLIPRIDEVVNAAANGVDNEQLRDLFSNNIFDGMKFFYERWTPVYLSIHGQKKTTHANRTLDKLFQDVIKTPLKNLRESMVKAIWYLLSISLEDMDNVPVFSDELNFSELESAIKNATRRIS